MQVSVFDFPPRIRLSDGAAEALKVLAVVLMSLDHINTFLLDDSIPAYSWLGRLAFPLFAFILGRNLARPGFYRSGAAIRLLKRLLLYALAATVPYVFLLGMKWSQLNILYTLLAGSAIVLLLKHGSYLAIMPALAIFLVAGQFVDYMWPGVALCVASWAYFEKPGWASSIVWVGALASLYYINSNLATLAVVPLLLLVSGKEIRFPRYKHFFYWFYPLHLALIGLLARN